MKYGGEGALTTTVMILYSWTWKNEHAPKRWREGVVFTCSRMEIRLTRETTDRGMTVGKTICKVLNDRMGAMFEKEEKYAKGKQGLGQIVAA